MNEPGEELEPAAFQPERIIAALNDHQVDYVVIGGMGAILHGAPVPPTKDIDVTPAQDQENLGRLAAALRDLGATLRVPGQTEGVSITLDERTFKNMITMTFHTDAGPFDVSLRPDGTEGYPDLVRAAVRIEFHGSPVPVAALDDIIRSKDAAGRPKDRAVLPDLREHSARQKEAAAAALAAAAFPEDINAALSKGTAQNPGPPPGRTLGDDRGKCRGPHR